MGEPSFVSIIMRDVELSVRIGEHAWEKKDAQRLRLDLALRFGLRDYNERHGGYVNYDPLRAFLKEIESRPHTERIETLARDILAACFDLTPTERVELTIMKPDVFPEMKGVGLHYDVARADFGG
jgi:dihydroneopterin aldolase